MTFLRWLNDPISTRRYSRIGFYAFITICILDTIRALTVFWA